MNSRRCIMRNFPLARLAHTSSIFAGCRPGSKRAVLTTAGWSAHGDTGAMRGEADSWQASSNPSRLTGPPRGKQRQQLSAISKRDSAHPRPTHDVVSSARREIKP
jgi:hypothetical protein